MSGDPIGDDVRKLRRERRLGEDRFCVLCGETEAVALQKVPASLLERHHLAGTANDGELVVVVCRNCHALLSEAQRDSEVELRHAAPRSSLERLEAVLRGLADFFALLAARLRWWADELAKLVSRLDRLVPDWRNDE
jgi:hypothetical protein